MMVRKNSLGLGRTPAPDQYGQTVSGAMQFTRDTLEWMEKYVDATDDHRKSSVEAWSKEFGELVKTHEEDLRPADSRNPGWVAIKIAEVNAALMRFMEQVAEDNAAIVADNKAIRGELKWMRGLAVSALIAMLIFLGQQLYVRL